ncbi:MAG: hypothetical protein RBS80_27405, partial [Thermoguttaceae bacterium]|nr:hypothetical protein [Thermoguttaceae bacterium]
MARGYGYVAADPFGGHSIGGEPPGTGDMTIESGEKVTFRYRYLFHEAAPTLAARGADHRLAGRDGPTAEGFSAPVGPS